MAKKIKRMLSLVVALCICVSVLPLQALAVTETSTTTETSPEGLPTDVTTTTTTETDEEGKTTVTVTIEKETAGTTTDGVNVKREESTTSTTITEENGAVTEQTTSEGSEKKEWTEEIKPGEDVPEVNATIQYETNEDGTVKVDENGNPIPKTDANGNIIISGSVTEGPVAKTEGDTTTTTTTEREVNGTVKIEEEFVIDADESKLECPRGPEDYEGKGYYDGSDDYCDPTDKQIYDTHYREGLLAGYTKDDIEYAVGGKPEEDGYEKGFDLTWTGHGDTTNAASAVYVEELVYLTDENGEIVTENGFPVVDMEKSKFVSGQNKKAENDPTTGYKATGMVSSIGQFVLRHENGNYFYAYCMDASTGASPEVNRWYNIRNMEDAIESEENPDGYLTEEEAGKIRAIATYGYWGNAEGQGSLDSLKELLKATYKEGDKINVRYPGSNTPYEYSIYELIDGLTESEALAVTQAAIWTYANFEDVTYTDNKGNVLTSGATVIGVLSASKYHNTRKDPSNPAYSHRWLNEYRPMKDGESDARLQALYQCLLSLDPIYADGELREDSTVIPNENVINDVALVIKDKVAEETANLDDNTDNDVYNTELNFKLAFIPGEKDEMFVCLMDANNQPILGEDGQPIRKLLASETSEKTGENVIKPINGVYTLTGLKLSENSEFEFDLRLEGTQYLEEGVYIYQAEGGRRESQTLVGLAKGEQKVEVSTQMTISFNVDEEKNVVAERVWHTENDPIYTPGEEDPDDTTTIPNDPVPYSPEPVEQRLVNDDTVTIEDEEVPLADTPETGDMTALWIGIIVAATVSLCAFNAFAKKRQQNVF